MKTITLCHLVAFIVVVLSSLHQGETALTLEVTQKVREECIKEVNLNADETKRINARELYSPKYSETSDPLKCYMLCFDKKLNLIDSNMKFNMDGLNDIFLLYFPDKKDKIKPALAKCSNVKSTKPCEMAHEIHGCVLSNIA